MNSEQLKQLFEKEVDSFKGWFANFSNLSCQDRWKLWQYYAEWLQARELSSQVSEEEIVGCSHVGTVETWGPDNDKCTKCGLTWPV